MLLLTILSIQQNSGYTTFHRRHYMSSQIAYTAYTLPRIHKSWVGLFLTHIRSVGAPHPGDNSWMRMYDAYDHDDRLKQTILTISTSVVLKKLPMESR